MAVSTTLVHPKLDADLKLLAAHLASVMLSGLHRRLNKRELIDCVQPYAL